jgi:cytochrome c
MVTAWQIPQDPTKDTTLDPKLADQIKWGYRLFVDTPHEAPKLTGGGVACANCHLNAGQRERALPLVGITGMFPEYNNRAARLISLRIASSTASCAAERDRPRHRGAARARIEGSAGDHGGLTWLGRGYP